MASVVHSRNVLISQGQGQRESFFKRISYTLLKGVCVRARASVRNQRTRNRSSLSSIKSEVALVELTDGRVSTSSRNVA